MIAHIDMDAFFASVELIDRPDLRGLPVVIGPTDPDFRGVVMTATYEARRFGIRSGMPMVSARRLCRELVVLPTSRDKYRARSEEVMAILAGFSAVIEQAGLDEAYLDLSDSPAPKARARQIRHEVRRATGLTCSIGLAPNRLIAKIASDLNKPDGICALPRSRFLEVVGGKPARTIPGVGPKTEERLRAAGIETVADLAGAPEDRLKVVMGPNQAVGLLRRANGHGSSAVVAERERKSESRERTFHADEERPEVMREVIADLGRAVADHLREQDLPGRTVTLKIRLAPFRTFTRSRTLSGSTFEATSIVEAAIALFEAFERDGPVRLLGVGVSNLDHPEKGDPLPAGEDPGGPQQLALV